MSNPKKKEKLHTIAVKVQNQAGVLGRISLIFSRRGFNIESLIVSSSFQNQKISTMTITAKGDALELEQIIKQLNKLINVISATDYLDEEQENKIIEKELALIKIKFEYDNLTKILQIIEHFKSQTLDLQADSLVIQVTGSTEKINASIGMLEQFNIIEVVRTGKMLIKRGNQET